MGKKSWGYDRLFALIIFMLLFFSSIGSVLGSDLRRQTEEGEENLKKKGGRKSLDREVNVDNTGVPNNLSQYNNRKMIGWRNEKDEFGKFDDVLEGPGLEDPEGDVAGEEGQSPEVKQPPSGKTCSRNKCPKLNEKYQVVVALMESGNIFSEKDNILDGIKRFFDQAATEKGCDADDFAVYLRDSELALGGIYNYLLKKSGGTKVNHRMRVLLGLYSRLFAIRIDSVNHYMKLFKHRINFERNVNNLHGYLTKHGGFSKYSAKAEQAKKKLIKRAKEKTNKLDDKKGKEINDIWDALGKISQPVNSPRYHKKKLVQLASFNNIKERVFKNADFIDPLLMEKIVRLDLRDYEASKKLNKAPKKFLDSLSWSFKLLSKYRDKSSKKRFFNSYKTIISYHNKQLVRDAFLRGTWFNYWFKNLKAQWLSLHAEELNSEIEKKPQEKLGSNRACANLDEQIEITMHVIQSNCDHPHYDHNAETLKWQRVLDKTGKIIKEFAEIANQCAPDFASKRIEFIVELLGHVYFNFGKIIAKKNKNIERELWISLGAHYRDVLNLNIRHTHSPKQLHSCAKIFLVLMKDIDVTMSRLTSNKIKNFFSSDEIFRLIERVDKKLGELEAGYDVHVYSLLWRLPEIVRDVNLTYRPKPALIHLNNIIGVKKTLKSIKLLPTGVITLIIHADTAVHNIFVDNSWSLPKELFESIDLSLDLVEELLEKNEDDAIQLLTYCRNLLQYYFRCKGAQSYSHKMHLNTLTNKLNEIDAKRLQQTVKADPEPDRTVAEDILWVPQPTLLERIHERGASFYDNHFVPFAKKYGWPVVLPVVILSALSMIPLKLIYQQWESNKKKLARQCREKKFFDEICKELKNGVSEVSDQLNEPEFAVLSAEKGRHTIAIPSEVDISPAAKLFIGMVISFLQEDKRKNRKKKRSNKITLNKDDGAAVLVIKLKRKSSYKHVKIAKERIAAAAKKVNELLNASCFKIVASKDNEKGCVFRLDFSKDLLKIYKEEAKSRREKAVKRNEKARVHCTEEVNKLLEKNQQEREQDSDKLTYEAAMKIVISQGKQTCQVDPMKKYQIDCVKEALPDIPITGDGTVEIAIENAYKVNLAKIKRQIERYTHEVKTLVTKHKQNKLMREKEVRQDKIRKIIWSNFSKVIENWQEIQPWMEKHCSVQIVEIDRRGKADSNYQYEVKILWKSGKKTDRVIQRIDPNKNRDVVRKVIKRYSDIENLTASSVEGNVMISAIIPGNSINAGPNKAHSDIDSKSFVERATSSGDDSGAASDAGLPEDTHDRDEDEGESDEEGEDFSVGEALRNILNKAYASLVKEPLGNKELKKLIEITTKGDWLVLDVQQFNDALSNTYAFNEDHLEQDHYITDVKGFSEKWGGLVALVMKSIIASGKHVRATRDKVEIDLSFYSDETDREKFVEHFSRQYYKRLTPIIEVHCKQNKKNSTLHLHGDGKGIFGDRWMRYLRKKKRAKKGQKTSRPEPFSRQIARDLKSQPVFGRLEDAVTNLQRALIGKDISKYLVLYYFMKVIALVNAASYAGQNEYIKDTVEYIINRSLMSHERGALRSQLLHHSINFENFCGFAKKFAEEFSKALGAMKENAGADSMILRQEVSKVPFKPSEVFMGDIGYYLRELWLKMRVELGSVCDDCSYSNVKDSVIGLFEQKVTEALLRESSKNLLSIEASKEMLTDIFKKVQEDLADNQKAQGFFNVYLLSDFKEKLSEQVIAGVNYYTANTEHDVLELQEQIKSFARDLEDITILNHDECATLVTMMLLFDARFRDYVGYNEFHSKKDDEDSCEQQLKKRTKQKNDIWDKRLRRYKRAKRVLRLFAFPELEKKLVSKECYSILEQYYRANFSELKKAMKNFSEAIANERKKVRVADRGLRKALYDFSIGNFCNTFRHRDDAHWGIGVVKQLKTHGRHTRKYDPPYDHFNLGKIVRIINGGKERCAKNRRNHYNFFVSHTRRSERYQQYREMYSVPEIYALIAAARSELLDYGREDNSEYVVIGAEQYAFHRENSGGILLLNPIHIDQFHNRFVSDIEVVLGQSQLYRNNNHSWQQPPRRILIPLLVGGHWIPIKIDITYGNGNIITHVNVLWDEPFGRGGYDRYFTDRRNGTTIREEILKGIRKIAESTDGQFIATEENFEIQFNRTVRQRDVINCGPIMVNHLRHYASNGREGEELVPEIIADDEEESMRRNREAIVAARKRDGDVRSSISPIERNSSSSAYYHQLSSLLDLLAQLKRTLSEANDSVLDREINSLADIQISHLHDVIAENRRRTGENLGKKYSAEEKIAALQLVKAYGETTQKNGNNNEGVKLRNWR